ncbi:PfkB family carbohydrate kinase [Levilactobacillus suantsaii]|uniref:Winged helix-turn-helix transcriptional regulator n=1 Tax=Levilactobacillus suantsaii TaxID=2292255 RepID=A0A4Q0VJL7_9LACO|nr:PfkB family carbohydrate kinase [Levilactobacillus suantsaii]QMU08932.1 winged helix-turn-helix transcriptional regulator [Levilactobacillus suantsaii]RXI78223.1 winged helix-turn-helix transcriptional regulator [Levilactobacillus suantsaii]
MATNREEQILEWIKQNPLISQNDLAKLAGITRSGVAAHISNLVKKGYIQGKGYIITPPRYVTVIGGVNIDTFGMAKEGIDSRSSYPGKIYNRLGGVGRNIAVNLSKMGIKTYLIAAFGDDQNGERFKENSLNQGVDITHSEQIPHEATSNYLYVNQPNGDRVVGIDDMGINHYMSPEYLEQRKRVINNSKLVVIDSNLPKRTIRWIYSNVTVPIFAKAVGLNKTMNLYDGLSYLDTLVINGIEATVLTKLPVTDENTARKCAHKLLNRGIDNIFIYIDDVGILYENKDKFYFFNERKHQAKNTNGAGAAATAALSWARLCNKDFRTTAQLGIAAADITSESNEAVNEKMTESLLIQQQLSILK